MKLITLRFIHFQIAMSILFLKNGFLSAEDLITCYCNRPYAGRPMVECDSCLTWIHITCTDLKRRDRVPDVWHCYKCVEKRNKTKGGSTSNIQVRA